LESRFFGRHRGDYFAAPACVFVPIDILPYVEKTLMGAKVLAVAERVVTNDKVERAGVAAKGLESQGGAGGVAFTPSDEIDLLADLVLHGGLFHAPEAELAPAGDRHLFDQRVFGRGFRLELLVNFGEDFEEAVF
jgi:hypothetical protein